MKSKYYRWLAKGRLLRRYDYLQEVNKILEEYITSRILAGGSEEMKASARKDLIEKQNEIKETNNMLAFLHTL